MKNKKQIQDTGYRIQVKQNPIQDSGYKIRGKTRSLLASCILHLVSVFLSCILHLASCIGLYAAGTTVGDVLNLHSSVRAVALGKTYLFDHSSGGNPAFSDGFNKVDFYYYSSALGVSVFYLGGKLQLKGFTLTGGIFNQNAGDIDIWRPGFGEAGDPEYIPEVRFTKNLQSDLIINLGCGYDVSKVLSFGLNTKYLNSKLLEDYSFNSAVFDFSSVLKVAKFSFALLLKNFGPDASYSGSEKKFPLPRMVSCGVGFYPSNFGIVLSADNFVVDRKTIYKTGIEWKIPDDKIYPLNSIILRGGYFHKDNFNIQNLTFGFSLGFSSFLFEYAVSPLDNVGFSHNFGLSYRFGYKTKIPESKIKEKIIIEFIDGNFEEKSFRKLEDTAQFLKESPNHSVKLEGHLELIDKILDYFVKSEGLSETRFSVEEKEIPYVEMLIISK